MRRLAAVATFGVLLALLWWTSTTSLPGLGRGAGPAAPARDASNLSAAAGDGITDMDASVERLRARLASAPDAAAIPIRDPFRFGSAPIATTHVTAVAPPLAPVVQSAQSAPLPTLVAISSHTTDAGVERSAVFSVRDDLVSVPAGGAIGAFVVTRVDADVVDLVDPSSGRTFRLH